MLTERNNSGALAGCLEYSLNTATAAVMPPLLHVAHREAHSLSNS